MTRVRIIDLLPTDSAIPVLPDGWNISETNGTYEELCATFPWYEDEECDDNA